MRLKLFILSCCFALHGWAQQVAVRVAGNWVTLAQEEMQTEIKPGWSIVGKKLKDTSVAYLWGKSAHQLTDDRKPVFRVAPGDKETLVDYAIVRLKVRKDYRRLPKDQLRQNSYTRIEPEHFSIKPDGDNAFICQPRQDMAAGEYVLVNISQTVGEQQAGYRVHPFCVR